MYNKLTQEQKTAIVERFTTLFRPVQHAASDAMLHIYDAPDKEREVAMHTYLASVLAIYFRPANNEENESLRLELVRMLLDDVQLVATCIARQAAEGKLVFVEEKKEPKDVL